MSETLQPAQVQGLDNAGWKIGVDAFSQKMTHGRRGHPLLHPRNEWRNIAYFYNADQMVKVWYYNNAALSKQDALNIASKAPAPAGNYITFKSVT